MATVAAADLHQELRWQGKIIQRFMPSFVETGCIKKDDIRVSVYIES
jgi:hypothetical protein